MAEHDGNIMQKIMALTAPPHSSPTLKLRGKRTRSHVNQAPGTGTTNGRNSGVDNHSYCDACGDGGDLLCCERCPASFHFTCCDPPMKPASLPDGEWLCHSCRPAPMKVEENRTLFRPLLLQAYSENPQQFFLPTAIKTLATIPDKLRAVKQVKSDKTCSNGDVLLGSAKLCHICNKSSKNTVIVSCNFCPLVYHLDCLSPPLTNPPQGSSWMCPSHAEHAVPGLHDARLTTRIAALEDCRAELAHHTIKMDFLAKLKEIPAYKRMTNRTNRRTVEVPPAIKALYMQPTLDSPHTPAVIDTLLTAAEHVEWMRNEGDKERDKLSVQRPPPLTHQDDEFTRRVVVCQMDASNNNSFPSSSTTHLTPSSVSSTTSAQSSSTSSSTVPPSSSNSQPHTYRSTLADLIEIIGPDGAEGLRSTPPSSSAHIPNGLLDTDQHSDKHINTDKYNGGGGGERDDECNLRDTSNECSGKLKQSCDGVAVSCDVPTSTTSLMSATENCYSSSSKISSIIPDVNQLNDHTLRLLASQRLQQLFTTSSHSNLNGLRPNLFQHTQTPVSVPRSRFTRTGPVSVQAATKAKGLLCPFSLAGPTYSIHKCVITIGTGSDMDVCLRDYSHCNFVSLHHACLLHDQETEEFELINYSEHGSIVDSVLYSCDFSEKAAANSEAAAVLMLDDLTARGDGIRAERAKRRLEAARKNLQDRLQANKAMSAAMSLSQSLSKDCVIDASGTKRTSEHLTVPGSPPSSVVSIPLAKARKNSPAQKTPDRTELQRDGDKESRSSLVPFKPCLCKRSASSVLGNEGKGWEGAANVYHGSRLRFGCIQLVLSVAGRSGHTELLHALKDNKLV